MAFHRQFMVRKDLGHSLVENLKGKFIHFTAIHPMAMDNVENLKLTADWCYAPLEDDLRRRTDDAENCKRFRYIQSNRRLQVLGDRSSSVVPNVPKVT